ncbi:MAG: sigma-54 dependent transcriptional regulator [Geobacteraceae bacterium]|nr:sigma-54 dependent transcriptional regulator [Geobacteraceae bacterium]
MRRVKLLIVEDDPLFGAALREVVEGAGYLMRLAVTGAAALEAVSQESFDLVVQDIKLPDANGLDILQEIIARQPHCGTIVMTGYGTIDSAVRAMKLGAFDFLTKPFPMETLFLKIESFLELRRMGKQIGEQPGEASPFSAIITRSPAMRAALEIAAKVALTPAPVLVQGESGTGKELVAEAIHRASERRGGPFIQVNCAAIPPNLLESELFGVEKGAFTGADRSRPGYIEMAAGGTLLLDEIGEMPFELQGKLLRVLEERGTARVGGTAFKSLDFRLICATNRNLSDMVKRGEFRKDLFFRINVVLVNLPPLRERREDIPLLLAHFLDRLCPAPAGRPEFTPEVLEMLCRYGYPGNIRELKNIVERITLLYPGVKVHRHHLPPEFLEPGIIGSTYEVFEVGKPLKEAVAEFEKRYIEKVTHYAGGRKTLAAKMLGLSRKVVWEKTKK